MIGLLRPRYTLRTLLVLVTLAAALFGYESYVSWKEERAARAIEKLYGSVEYDYIGPEWLRRFAGEDYLRRVTSARIHSATTDGVMPALRTLRRLSNVEIVSDLAGYKGFNPDEFEKLLPNVKLYVDPWGPDLRRYGSELDRVVAILNESGDVPFRHESRDFFGSAIVVKFNNGKHLLLVVERQRFPSIYLIDGRRIVDWKLAEVPTTLQVRKVIVSVAPQIADINGDGDCDVGFHLEAERVSMGRSLGRDPYGVDFHSDRNVLCFWLAAYEITPTGFKSLFGPDSAGAAESASTE